MCKGKIRYQLKSLLFDEETKIYIYKQSLTKYGGLAMYSHVVSFLFR